MAGGHRPRRRWLQRTVVPPRAVAAGGRWTRRRHQDVAVAPAVAEVGDRRPRRSQRMSVSRPRRGRAPRSEKVPVLVVAVGRRPWPAPKQMRLIPRHLWVSRSVVKKSKGADADGGVPAASSAPRGAERQRRVGSDPPSCRRLQAGARAPTCPQAGASSPSCWPSGSCAGSCSTASGSPCPRRCGPSGCGRSGSR